MKRLFTLFFAFVLYSSAQASIVMLIHPKEGGTATRVLLSEQPVATYEGEELVIATTSTTLRFPLTSIERLTFSEEETVVKSVSVLQDQAGESRVYNIKGELLKTVPAGQEVSLDQLPAGLYIIKNNISTYKILKK